MFKSKMSVIGGGANKIVVLQYIVYLKCLVLYLKNRKGLVNKRYYK